MANVFDQFDSQQPGSKNVFDQFDPDYERRAMQERLDQEVRAKGARDYTGGLGEGVSQFSNLVMDPFGVRDEMIGFFGGAIPEFIRSGGDLEKSGQAYTDRAERVRAEQRAAREDYGILPEVLGGLGTSTAVKGVTQVPSLAKGLLDSAKIGGTFGAAAGAGHGEGSVGERLESTLEGGLTGAVAAPILSHAVIPGVSRLYGGAKDALRYANQSIKNVRNPEQAAINSIADRLPANASPAQLRAEVSPPASPNLKNRGFTEADLADIVSRQLAGESADSVAASYAHLVNRKGQKFTAQTARNYLKKYQDANPTERNIIDIAKDLSGDGGAGPVTRLARAAHSLSDDGEAAQRLLTRQQTQAGRVSNIIDRAGKGRSFDDEIAALEDVVSNQARTAYAAAEANAQPFELRPVISKYRRMAFGKGGEIREQMEKAIDLFFEPTLAGKGTARSPLQQRKLGQPISDMKKFQSARQELDQMIARSMQDGRPTPLTRGLTKLRQEMTGVVRQANPDLAAADDLFSGAKSAERLLEAGEKLTTRLGAPSRDLLKGFEKLTDEQQELFRIGFLKRLQDMAANTREGRAVADQFNSPAVQQTIERIFPKSKPEIYKRGQALLKNLKQESTTTRTTRDVLSGSRTAELSSDMDKMLQGAQTAADVATGRFWKVLENLATRLTTQIGERGSKEVLKVLTETDPAKLLQNLNRLAKAAKTTQERRAYVSAIRELRAAKGFRGIAAGTGVQQDKIKELISQ